MRIHFLPNKSREAIAQALGLPPFIVGELSKAINNYNPKMIAANIALLHEYDLKSMMRKRNDLNFAFFRICGSNFNLK